MHSQENDHPIRTQRRSLVQLAYRFLWNYEDAEDVVQQAIALAHEKRESLRDESAWRAWVNRIVVRQCLLLQRSERIRHDRHKIAAEHREANLDKSPDNESTPESQQLHDAIRQLPPRQRAAITLRYLEEMSYEQIAEIMEQSAGTVRAHTRAARENLSKTLSGPIDTERSVSIARGINQ